MTLSSKGGATPTLSGGSGPINQIGAPAIALPKGGGAIRGIGEKFEANSVTGSGSVSVPLPTSHGRSGFGPQLSGAYDSGSGNGPFGFGWSLSIASIARKTDKGLPQYRDAEEFDVYILSGAEDLVPALEPDGTRFQDAASVPGYVIHRYRPRIEGLFARVERWTNLAIGEIHWRSITRDNVTTHYGVNPNTRICDAGAAGAGQPVRVFSWLISHSYDDKGNAVVYEYAEENGEGVDCAAANERNRERRANRYLKRIRYGNRAPSRDAATWQPLDPHCLPDDTWMFEVVFDYQEGHYAEDVPDAEGRVFAQAWTKAPDGAAWAVRTDPFSSYRSGFEVRTYRLCRRVLLFHHFPLELGTEDYLVRTTEFRYSETPAASFVESVVQSGYTRQTASGSVHRYLKRSFPPLEFTYSQVPSADSLASRPVRDVDPDSLENLPAGLDGSFQWVDLEGAGLSGILTEQADGWFYKRNLSANHLCREGGEDRVSARFGPSELMPCKPAAGLSGGDHFQDLAGDGRLELVRMEAFTGGSYARSGEGWEPFRQFVSAPNLDFRDSNLRFVDLTGDGCADILITEAEALRWHPSMSEEGFGPAVRVAIPLEEEKGPRVVFGDATQSIYLADLSGDGLSDLVRIRNGEICYWPNLGYGHFGPKVTMDHAPWFDTPGQFDQRRIRLVDVDGSGTTDILYLGSGGVQIYFNYCGNGWSAAVSLPQFAALDTVSKVEALDLLGNGTACLVWSSALPACAGQRMQYLTLMDEKPHLLVGIRNNLGADTAIHYAPSTKFYLDDRERGRPWITRLPFPVQVVERVETYDRISRNRFVTRYAYHHGYFDRFEREFRGFALVEQYDTGEFAALAAGGGLDAATNLDAASHVPPALTKTWFYTGVYIGRGHVSDYFAGLTGASDSGEYYRGAGLTAQQAADLLLPTLCSRPACRSRRSARPAAP